MISLPHRPSASLCSRRRCDPLRNQEPWQEPEYATGASLLRVPLAVRGGIRPAWRWLRVDIVGEDGLVELSKHSGQTVTKRHDDCNRSTFFSVNARFLLALGLSVPEFPFPIEAFGRNPLDPARASGPIRATMPLFVAFPEAGAVSKRCLGSCQSAPEHVRPRLKAKSSKTLQSGTSGYT